MGFNLSGGFAAGGGADALQELLKQAFIQQAERRRAGQEDKRIQQEQQRLTMAGDDRKAAMADLAQSRDVQNATRISGQLQPEQLITPQTVGALRAGGLGDLTRHDAADLPSTAISGAASAGAKAPIMGSLRMASAGRPERDTFTGTDTQLQTRQAREERAAQIAQAAQDRKEAAALAAQQRTDAATAAQQGREDLARLSAGLHGSNADLQRQILQDKIDAAHDKTSEQHKTADAAKSAAVASIDDTTSALDELLDPNGQLKNGVGGAVGWDALRSRIPGTSAADAKARIDRLQSRLTVDLLGEMKRQSRTGASGFGALSEKELMVLQNAAARLGSSQSDESFRQALIDVRKQLSGMRQRAAGAAPATAPPKSGGFSVVEIK